MYKTLSNFSVSHLRSRVLVWTLLAILTWSFVPSVSLAQQPTATISALSGTVLVNGQEAGKGTVLSAGDVIETQVGASVVLELSDGSLLELGENTKVDIAELSQTATGARVSYVKLLWGRIRAMLSPDHQQAGSAFDISTPNALVGVKFSQPDVEVSYDPAKQETIALALTVALAVKNLITDEEKIIPIGSMAIITALGIKVMAGAAVATGVIGAEAAAGMSTATKVAIGAGAVAAAGGGVVAIAASSGNGGDSDTAESTGDLSGIWALDAQGVSQGCTEDTPCMAAPPYLCGTDICGSFKMGDSDIHVSQTGNEFLASETDGNGNPFTLNGIVDGNLVSFTIQGTGITPGIGPATTTYTGTIDGNTIRGSFSGSASWTTPDGRTETATWTGTFTVTIEKE
jgi:hypothetical protein